MWLLPFVAANIDSRVSNARGHRPDRRRRGTRIEALEIDQYTSATRLFGAQDTTVTAEADSYEADGEHDVRDHERHLARFVMLGTSVSQFFIPTCQVAVAPAFPC